MILWKASVTFQNFEFYCLHYILFYKLCYIFSEKSSLFSFCKFFLSRRSKDLVFVKISISLGWNYSLSSINKAWELSREHWWSLIIFKSIYVVESLIEDLCLKYLVHTSKWRVELLFFSTSSLINFAIVYIWPIYQSLDKRIWFTILFFSS